MAEPLVLPPDEMAALKKVAEAVCAQGWGDTILPPARPAGEPLTKDEIRQLLRECVTVVKPGEILVLRPGADFTPNQLREIHLMVNHWLAENAPDIRALVIPGEAAQIMRQSPGEVTHRCPPEGEGLMPCCGLTPYEVPRTDRMTLADDLVTCTGEKRDHA